MSDIEIAHGSCRITLSPVIDDETVERNMQGTAVVIVNNVKYHLPDLHAAVVMVTAAVNALEA